MDNVGIGVRGCGVGARAGGSGGISAMVDSFF